MHKPDGVFFDSYKELERICSDIYGTVGGVSRYIENMEAIAVSGRNVVENWDRDYKTLKHLRWVRNKIAHETSVTPISTEDDLADLEAFKRRIVTVCDPLATLRRRQEEAWRNAEARRMAEARQREEALRKASSASKTHSNTPDIGGSSNGCLTPTLYAVGTVLIALILIVFLG